jgi:hypothetical protein
MGSRAPDAVGRLAVQRARVRMPALSPDSVEVVELVRGQAFVVVRTNPSGVLVLDESGRLVRGRPRLAAIARHLRAVRQVDAVLAETQLERRLEHASRSTALLERLAEAVAAKQLRRGTIDLRQDVELFRTRLVALRDEQRRFAPATERTLRRTVACLNAAARADRRVVRATRSLGAALAGVPNDDRTSPVASLRRWVVARLGSPDLPFFHEEIDASDESEFVREFVVAARS